jgi:hypothetical protein
VTVNLAKLPVLGPFGEALGANAAKKVAPVKPVHTQLERAAEAILKAGEKFHINPAYLWGIYGTETSFGSAIAVSSTGARGPFQFEPATAKQYGYPLGVNESKITDWGAFQKQADAAAKFLAAHGGTKNISAAVKAYNPGEASYLSKVLTHAKSFARPFNSGAENQAEADKLNAPVEPAGGIFSELITFFKDFAITGTLLLVGAVLVIYGIMVAVRPRENAFGIPRPPLPLPV